MTLLGQALWSLGSLGLLLVARRWMSDWLQRCLLLILRRPDRALVAYSVTLLPGVLLHESSHWLTARALGVRAGPISLIPRLRPGGMLQLGSVEVESSDPLRSTLIGSAPLIAGTLALLGLVHVWPGVQAAWQAFDGSVSGGIRAAQLVAAIPWSGLWFYLAWAVSNTMLPSPSDRRGWFTMFLILGTLAAGMIYLGYGPALLARIQEPLTFALRTMAGIFVLTVVIDLLASLPMILLSVILGGLG